MELFFGKVTAFLAILAVISLIIAGIAFLSHRSFTDSLAFFAIGYIITDVWRDVSKAAKESQQ